MDFAWLERINDKGKEQTHKRRIGEKGSSKGCSYKPRILENKESSIRVFWRISNYACLCQIQSCWFLGFRSLAHSFRAWHAPAFITQDYFYVWREFMNLNLIRLLYGSQLCIVRTFGKHTNCRCRFHIYKKVCLHRDMSLLNSFG